MSSNTIIPNPGFRENPSRAIYIDQEIDEKLFREITKKFHDLLSQSRDPITVYICSPGGSVRIFEWIKDLLWTNDQTGQRARIVTMAKGMAASAAARLLVLGDYSMSYPASIIHCHGTRLPQVDEVTRERAETISRLMEDSNRATADEFVGRILYNLAFLFDSNRNEIQKITTEGELNSIVALSNFIHLKLSSNAREIMDGVFEDLSEAERLSSYLARSPRRKLLHKSQIRGQTDYERTLVKIIIDFLFEQEWKHRPRLTDSFSQDARRLFKSHRHLQDNMLVGANLMDIIPLLLTEDEFELYTQAQHNDTLDQFLPTTLAPLLVPLWQLANSISNRLVAGENPLGAFDAYWLGLIQEVVGSDLPCLRHVAEAKPLRTPKPSTKKRVKSPKPPGNAEKLDHS